MKAQSYRNRIRAYGDAAASVMPGKTVKTTKDFKELFAIVRHALPKHYNSAQIRSTLLHHFKLVKPVPTGKRQRRHPAIAVRRARASTTLLHRAIRNSAIMTCLQHGVTNMFDVKAAVRSASRSLRPACVRGVLSAIARDANIAT